MHEASGYDERVTVEVIDTKPGQAARLLAGGLSRYHALDDFGIPFCMSILNPPIYRIDMTTLLDRRSVHPDFRCHRWGCVSAWG